jgi:hypothetical protein
MEQIVIELKDKAKAQMLYKLLSALDFVSSVKTSKSADIKTHAKKSKEQLDFFALAGLWSDREINLESLRKQAWPRQSK